MSQPDPDDRDFDFEELVEGEYDFYGVDGQRFRLDDTTYEVIEHDDGRFEVVVSEERLEGMPVARVTIEHEAFNDFGYELNDLHDDHCWLAFGSVLRFVGCEVYEFYFDNTPKGPGD